MFDPVSFASLVVTPMPDVGITLIFHGLFYTEGRLHLAKAADKIIEST